MTANFYRYYFNNRVCAAVNAKDQKEVFFIGLSFRNPHDSHEKSAARSHAMGRLSEFPYVLPKDGVGPKESGVDILTALARDVAKKYAELRAGYVDTYGAEGEKAQLGVAVGASNYAVKMLRKEYDMPYWFIHKLVRLAAKKATR